MATYDVKKARQVIRESIDWPVENNLNSNRSSLSISFDEITVQEESQRTEIHVNPKYNPVLSTLGAELENAFESDPTAKVIQKKTHPNRFLLVTVDDSPEPDGRPHKY